METMKYYLLAFTLFISLFSTTALANGTNIDSLNTSLYRSSNRYVESGITYRVLKWETLQRYFDDIKALDEDKTTQISEAQEKITFLKDKNEAQANSHEELKEKYDYAVRANDAMEFFTLLIPKKQYNLIMWSLVLGLIAFVIILLVMYKRSHQVTRNAQKERDESREEYEAYRQRTLRREQEVANGYLREINKLKSQLGM